MDSDEYKEILLRKDDEILKLEEKNKFLFEKVLKTSEELADLKNEMRILSTKIRD